MLRLLLLVVEVRRLLLVVAVEQRRRRRRRRRRQTRDGRTGRPLQQLQRRSGRLAALLLQLLMVLLGWTARSSQPGVVGGGDGGRRGCGVMVIVDDGRGQVPEPVVGGQHVGEMVMVVRLWRLWRSASGTDRVRVPVRVVLLVLVVVVVVLMVRVSGRWHVRVHHRLVPPALAPVARYRHVQLVQCTELVHSRLVRVQVLYVSK